MSQTITTDNDDLLILSDEITDNQTDDDSLILVDDLTNSSDDLITFGDDISSTTIEKGGSGKSELIKNTTENSSDLLEISGTEGGFNQEEPTDNLLSVEESEPLPDSGNVSLIEDTIGNTIKDTKEDNGLDLGANFTLDDSGSTELESTEEEDILDLPDTSTDTSKQTLEGANLTEGSQVGSMTDILDEALFKFVSRSDAVNDEISINNDNISATEEERKALEKKLTSLKNKGDSLKDELGQIDKNSKAIEKMKNATITKEKTSTSIKIHSAKRKVV